MKRLIPLLIAVLLIAPAFGQATRKTRPKDAPPAIEAPAPVVQPDVTPQRPDAIPLDKLTRLEIENTLLQLRIVSEPLERRVDELFAAWLKEQKLDPALWGLDMKTWVARKRPAEQRP